jgi:hypothetical protein
LNAILNQDSLLDSRHRSCTATMKLRCAGIPRQSMVRFCRTTLYNILAKQKSMAVLLPTKILTIRKLSPIRSVTAKGQLSCLMIAFQTSSKSWNLTPVCKSTAKRQLSCLTILFQTFSKYMLWKLSQVRSVTAKRCLSCLEQYRMII